MVEPIRVVHVDDEPGFAELTAEFLARVDERIEVRSTVDPDEALELAGDAGVDCIVSDYEMPDVDGIDLLRAVRRDRPDLPFILFTGKGSEDLASAAISSGVTDYLRKDGGTDQYAILANRIVNAVESARAKATVHRLQRLSEAFPDLIFHIDEAGRYLDVLAGSTNLLVYDDPEDLIGRRFHDLLSPETADRFVATVRRALETGDLQNIEYRLDVQAGLRWFEARVVPLEATLSDGPAVVWAARDITERKEQERDLQWYRSLVDAMQDPVCIYDDQGRYALVNQHLADRYGLTTAELQGQPSKLVDRIREESDGDPFRELLDREREELRPTFTSPSLGEDVVMEYRLTRLEIDGRCEGVVAVSRDVSERHRRERELERTNHRLEAFVSVVSHDLRNPLNVAQGRLELARETGDRDHLDAAESALDRMGTLIADLLEMAQHGEAVTMLEPVDLTATCRTCWATVDTADASLETAVDLVLLADEGRLRQLLENLFRNAVEHGGEVVTVRVGALDAGFYVDDDGPGIPEADRERVFERGFSSMDDGSGLGLRIVDDVAAEHGWAVTVTDSETGGARFELTDVEVVE